MTALFAVALTLAVGPPADPDRLFAEALEAREDAAQARPKFAAAARAYDAVWRDGDRTATVAVNRGRAHALAGDAAGAVAAVHAGLQRDPSDRVLQQDLETYRDAIPYPAAAKPDERLRPDPPGGWRSRVRDADLFWFAAACTLGAVVGVARRFTARDSWATPVVVAAAVGLLAVGCVLWQSGRERAADLDRPLVVLRAETMLRRGNGETHSARLDTPLPRGAEVRVMHRRGGWSQVEVAGGAAGWLPDDALLPVE